jgi:hypothetical protein
MAANTSGGHALEFLFFRTALLRQQMSPNFALISQERIVQQSSGMKELYNQSEQSGQSDTCDCATSVFGLTLTLSVTYGNSQ